MLMIASDEPWKELGHGTEIASTILRTNFDKVFGMIIEDLGSGEIARIDRRVSGRLGKAKHMTTAENPIKRLASLLSGSKAEPLVVPSRLGPVPTLRLGVSTSIIAIIFQKFRSHSSLDRGEGCFHQNLNSFNSSR